MRHHHLVVGRLSRCPRAGASACLTGTGEIRDGFVHLHVIMGVEGDRAIAGHFHEARIGTHFARAYVNPVG